MVEQTRSLPLIQIPRYIANLNAMATAGGLSVDVAVESVGNDPELRLWSYWRGSRSAFLTLVQPVASYRLPLSCGQLNIPGGAGYYAHNSLVSGSVKVNGNDVVFKIDFGPAEFTVRNAGGVQMVSYADETLYHGTANELIALGIERSRLPMKKKAAISDGGGSIAKTEKWASRRQPDGLILHRVESPSALRQRRKEWSEYLSQREQCRSPEDLASSAGAPRPSHLRLVVDNTGGSIGLRRGD
jgi:hypothetical protein